MGKRVVFWLIILILNVNQIVSAQGVGTVGFGYSKLSIDGEHGADLDGWGFALHFQFWPGTEKEGLLARFGIQGTWNNGDSDLDPDNIFYSEKIWNVNMLTPQVEVGLRKEIGTSLFVEPSVAVGWAIALYEPRYIFDEEDIATGLAVRPGLIIGLGSNRPCLGIDLSYGLVQIDFEDGVGDNNHDLYLGVCFRF